MSSSRYLSMRSVGASGVVLICYDAEYDTLPDEVRKKGPWRLLRQGGVQSLRDDLRLAVEATGYVFVEASPGALRVEK